MTRIAILLAAACLVAFSATALTGATDAEAAKNPFISSKQSKQTPSKNPMAGYPAFLKPLMDRVAAFQHTIKQQMVRLAKDIQQHPSGPSFWGFMLLSFGYGVIHALGPGHGKIYTCSYFLSRPGTLKKVLLFGNLTMLMHVISGTVLILFGALVLKTSGAMTLENSGPVLERFSYGMLVGIVPCPGAALILLFALTLGILTAGLWGMLCIALGMAITTCAFALGAISFRKTFLSLAQGNDRIVAAIHGVLSLGGALCISMLGLLLLVGTF